MTPLISIIMPAYQSEKWIEESINSVIMQKYKNVELIIVNDGSTDSTESICRTLMAQYPQIHLINQKNGGVAKARNVGMQNAKGEYLLFLDADDKYAADFLEECVPIIENKKPDLLFFDFTLQKKECERNYSGNYEDGLVNKEDIPLFVKTALKSNLMQNIGNKFYKKEIFSKMNFREDLTICEDVIFALQAIQISNSVYYRKKSYYYYRFVNNTSLSQNKTINYYKDHLEFLREVKLCWGKDEKYNEWYYLYYMDVMNSILQKLSVNPKLLKRVCDLIANESEMTIAKTRAIRCLTKSETKKKLIYQIIGSPFSFFYYAIYGKIKRR